MRIHDIISEAISLTQHFDDLAKVANQGIFKALANVHSLKNNPMLRDAEEESRNIVSLRPLFNELVQLLYEELRTNMADELRAALPKYVPYGKHAAVEFKNLPGGTRGSASGLLVNLSNSFPQSLASEILRFIQTVTLDNLEREDQLVDEFYNQMKNLIKSGSRSQRMFMDDGYVQNVVDDMIDVMIHELVHTSQHYPQYEKGRDRTEYRSYLDKKKQGFIKGGEVSNFDLYYASPQEITAFSHNIALRVINQLGLRFVKSLDEIEKVDSDTITYYIDDFLRGRFKNPANPNERAVYNKYIKSAYLEIDRYIDKLKERLTAKGK